MATALVAGASSPLGQALVRTLAGQGIATIAHVRADGAELKKWQQRFNMPRVRVDNVPWITRALFDLVDKMRPTHVFSVLPATPERLLVLNSHGVPSENYEETNFKLTNMLIDAVVNTRNESHFVYVRPAGAVGAYAQAMDRAEDKIRVSGLPHTILHAPPVDEMQGNNKLMALRMIRKSLDGLWASVGWLGLRDLSAQKRSISCPRLAMRLVDQAIGSSEAHLTLLARDVH